MASFVTFFDITLRRASLMVLGFYRRYVSSDERRGRRHCRYWPSCSLYATQAFERHSFPRALHLSFLRVFRCNPFCVGGYDPLP